MGSDNPRQDEEESGPRKRLPASPSPFLVAGPEQEEKASGCRCDRRPGTGPPLPGTKPGRRPTFRSGNQFIRFDSARCRPGGEKDRSDEVEKRHGGDAGGVDKEGGGDVVDELHARSRAASRQAPPGPQRAALV